MGIRSCWNPGLSPKPCDTCQSSPAAVFCHADSAFLCLACDSANKLASRHQRVWMCEVCEQAPASVTCKADAAALCVTCDADIHSANPLARRHERVPIQPFLDCPESVVMYGSDAIDTADLLIPNLNFVIKPDALYAEVASLLDEFDYPINPICNSDMDSVVPLVHHESCKNKLSSSFSYPTAHSISQSVSSSSLDVGIVPDGNSFSESGVDYGVAAPAPATQLTGVDREARVMRYREKKKNRKFQKTIRYASRKAYAETRPRIKGRFAKRTETETETEVMDRIFNLEPAAIYMAEAQYGVVPTF